MARRLETHSHFTDPPNHNPQHFDSFTIQFVPCSVSKSNRAKHITGQMTRLLLILTLAALVSSTTSAFIVRTTPSKSLWINYPQQHQQVTRQEEGITCIRSTSTSIDTNDDALMYPGTAVERMKNVRSRVATLSQEDLSGDWEFVRRKLLWAGGLRDLPDAIPGQVSSKECFSQPLVSILSSTLSYIEACLTYRLVWVNVEGIHWPLLQ